MKSVTEWVSSSFNKDGGKQTKTQKQTSPATKPAATNKASHTKGKPVKTASGHNNKRQHRKPNQQPKPQQGKHVGGGKGKVRVFPLGGFEQIGRNCMVIEVNENYYIVDLGLQFPDEDMLGIDYLIPDISFFKGKENRIKGIFFTHGHLDHIGGVQHLLDKLKFPPCYGTKMTIAMIKKRLDEAKLTDKSKLVSVDYRAPFKVGNVGVEFVRMTHSIPNCAGIAFNTPAGLIYHTGDFKFDMTPINEPPADFQRLAELGEKGVLAVIADSTNATIPGFSKSESSIVAGLDLLVGGAKGRVIVSTFSSLINRIQQATELAKKYNRKVFVAGRSMETNIEIAQNLGFIKSPRGMIRKVGPAMDKLPDNQVMILTTGSQGESNAGLARIGLGTHRQIGVKKGDTIILSSNPIIGNQRSVMKVINNLITQGAIVHTNDELALHTTGHGHQEDILLLHNLLKAKHIIPEHGEPHMRDSHAGIAKKLGYEDNQIHLIKNGEILEFDAQGGCRKSKQKINLVDVIIDGKSRTDEGQRVLTDRKVLSNGGVVVINYKVYAKSKRLVGDPEVISRGVIYGSELRDMVGEITKQAKKAYLEAVDRGETDKKAIRRIVQGALYRYFNRKLNREPMVVPIIVEV
jgi:ribonuclease J